MDETVLITGVSGNLGTRLVPLLTTEKVIGVDFKPPLNVPVQHFLLDLGTPHTEHALARILLEQNVTSVVHLAFVIDPLRTGVLDEARMWQINVAGTARILSAVAEANRAGGYVRTFIYPSSVAVYGPDTQPLVSESARLGAHTLPYAIHKQQADGLVRDQASRLGHCSTYVLRPHIFTGASVQNYLVNAIRGQAFGESAVAKLMRARGVRLPLLLPVGDQYPKKLFQFVHVDDVARLIAWLVRRPVPETSPEHLVLNVAGSGDPITIARCAEIAHAKLLRLPSRRLCRAALALLWDMGISSVPPDALPYIIGSYTMNTVALHQLLGEDYRNVIQHSTEEALADSFSE